ncbi:hypothetical protein [Enterococcus mundtii]|uniref:hypothetical protein n=1 Tax=Enterococcus mundtii TaxID=53346 RepID=UPI00403CCC28
MKFLEKETDRFVLTMVEKNICMKELVLTYGFFHEENYKGEESHKKAALAFVTAINQKRGHTKIEYTDRVNFPVNLRKTYSINQLLMQGFIIEGNIFFSTAYIRIRNILPIMPLLSLNYLHLIEEWRKILFN